MIYSSKDLSKSGRGYYKPGSVAKISVGHLMKMNNPWIRNLLVIGGEEISIYGRICVSYALNVLIDKQWSFLVRPHLLSFS